MPAILNAGRDLIAQKQGAAQVLTINQFVLANIAGLDDTADVNLDEVLPASGDIVYQGAVTQSGYVSLDQVVYSLLLGTNIGDFDFNWLGLLASDGTLIAVSYVPLQQKRKTVGLNLGNAITRNFLLAFNDAQSTTNITVSAETWQIDFMARLDDQDQRERQSNADIYGPQAFFGDGYLVWNDAGTHKLKTGAGYINGVRVHNTSEQTLAVGALPKDVWLDVSLQGDAAGVIADVQMVFDNAVQADYIDGINRQHYLVKIASIDGGGAVTDLRTSYAVTNGVLAFLLDAMPVPASQEDVNAGSNVIDYVTSKTLHEYAEPKMWRKNYIINGAMAIAQRGTGAFSSGYTLDRWAIFSSGAGGVVAISQTATLAPENSYDFGLYWNQTTLAASSPYLEQRIENVKSLQGKTVTLSFTAFSAAPISITPRLRQNFGSGGSPSANIDIVGSSISITTDLTRFTQTFTLPYLTGKTIGANNDDFLALMFALPSGSIFDLTITEVQLEEGGIATPFDYRHISDELVLCQRYFQKGTFVQFSHNPIINTNVSFNHNHRTSMAFNNPMRNAPSMTIADDNGLVNAVTALDQDAFTLFSVPGLISATPENFVGGMQSTATTHASVSFGMSFAWTADAEL